MNELVYVKLYGIVKTTITICIQMAQENLNTQTQIMHSENKWLFVA